jgi:LAO/AO transport system kinase
MGLINCDIVIVETVGVGQMEFSIREVSDIVAVVLAPGQGDTVQFLKAGLMEVGDVFVVNKYDRPDAKRFLAQLKDALGFSCPVLKEVFPVSARDNIGIKEFTEYLERCSANDSVKWNELRASRLKMLVHRVIISEVCKKAERELSKKVFDPAEEIFSGEETLQSITSDLLWKMSR